MIPLSPMVSLTIKSSRKALRDPVVAQGPRFTAGWSGILIRLVWFYKRPWDWNPSLADYKIHQHENGKFCSTLVKAAGFSNLTMNLPQ